METSIELPTFADAQTLKLGVVGLEPPMDYTAANGKPAGFNTALSSALATKIKANIVLVPVAIDSCLAALSSGKIDALFLISNTVEPLKEDKSFAFTDAYYRSPLTLIV